MSMSLNSESRNAPLRWQTHGSLEEYGYIMTLRWVTVMRRDTTITQRSKMCHFVQHNNMSVLNENEHWMYYSWKPICIFFSFSASAHSSGGIGGGCHSSFYRGQQRYSSKIFATNPLLAASFLSPVSIWGQVVIAQLWKFSSSMFKSVKFGSEFNNFELAPHLQNGCGVDYCMLSPPFCCIFSCPIVQKPKYKVYIYLKYVET